MNRSYRSERYVAWVRRIRETIPGIAFSTDIIVGFPGETEEDFRGTLRVVEEARFDSAFAFQYSPRPGTRAASFPDQVSKEVVQERFDRLIALQERISLDHNRDLVGRTMEVLVEGTGRKGGTQGRTRTNKVVHFDGSHDPGEFLDVRIIAAHPHHLGAEPVREPAAV
jgi:tRNA-2-methylthio-N6-dimethylallyladenosine synthase